MRLAIARCAIGLLAVLATACGPGSRTASDAVRLFLNAVQDQDLDRLYCRVAGAAEAGAAGGDEARAAFEAWALARYDGYLEGRDEGRVELDDHGLALVKLFALGKGTFYKFGPTRSSGSDVLLVDMEVRFGYAHLDLSRFTPGTTFYVCGAPVGRVNPVRVPSGSGEVSVDVLESVRLRWTLVRAPATDGCPDGWTVATVEPIEGSEVLEQVTWVF